MPTKRSQRPETRGHFVGAVSSELGWIAFLACGHVLQQVSFGQGTRAESIAGLGRGAQGLPVSRAWPTLAERLENYAAGTVEDFREIELDLAHLSTFERKVVAACRSIPYGEAVSYGRLAVLAGSPRAARAVGNVMAANRFPLVVPCHRVIHADGRLGRYSAPAGQRMKLRLLEQEGAFQQGSLLAKQPAARGILA